MYLQLMTHRRGGVNDQRMVSPQGEEGGKKEHLGAVAPRYERCLRNLKNVKGLRVNEAENIKVN